MAQVCSVNAEKFQALLHKVGLKLNRIIPTQSLMKIVKAPL